MSQLWHSASPRVTVTSLSFDILYCYTNGHTAFLYCFWFSADSTHIWLYWHLKTDDRQGSILTKHIKISQLRLKQKITSLNYDWNQSWFFSTYPLLVKLIWVRMESNLTHDSCSGAASNSTISHAALRLICLCSASPINPATDRHRKLMVGRNCLYVYQTSLPDPVTAMGSKSGRNSLPTTYCPLSR